MMMNMAISRFIQLSVLIGMTLGSAQAQNTVALTNKNLQEAADLWVSNETDATDRYGLIKIWDVSSITNMDELFLSKATFNADISLWDVSKVNSMTGMFNGATTFNRDISGWNVSNVVNMGLMFILASSFNQVISAWDVSKVTDMASMFNGAAAFNQDISEWNVSSVTRTRGMFKEASAFNKNISAWNVGSVTDMGSMFYDAPLFDQDIAGWNVSKVTTMGGMFNRASSFNQDISGWDVSEVLDMSFMFTQATSFNLDISLWDVSKVTTTRSMFNGATAFNLNISGWNVASVTDMTGMFSKAVFNLDISGWNVSGVTTMRSMFNQNEVFDRDISNWNVAKVNDMSLMFYGASSFNQNISGWVVSAVTKMDGMFQQAFAFNRDISVWDVSSVKNMGSMFSAAASFNQNLCAWGNKLPLEDNLFDASSSFVQNGCTESADPSSENTPPGPFCYSCGQEQQQQQNVDSPGDGGVQGDPHFKTWRGEHYDFHGECDLILLQSKEFETGLDLDVHIRTQMLRDMSYISSAVLRIGSDVLEVESQGIYYLNGVANAKLPNEFSGFEFLHTKPTDKIHVFEVYLGGRERVKLKTYKDFVSVLIEQGLSKHFGKSVGLMGDFGKGRKFARDGTTVLDDMNAFGQEWQVLNTDPTLFQTARFPQYPQKCTMPTSKASSMLRRRLSESSIDELAAEKACEQWGEGKDDCVFDVLTTGDLEMAMVGAY